MKIFTVGELKAAIAALPDDCHVYIVKPGDDDLLWDIELSHSDASGYTPDQPEYNGESINLWLNMVSCYNS